MKILFLTRRAWPKVGGVEKHVYEISKILKQKGHIVRIISEDNIKYPKIKVLGLLYIWYWLFINRKYIINSDVIHLHDVFIWYLPFYYLFRNKHTFITVHGLEWDNPLSFISLAQKRWAVKKTNGSIGVGHFLEYYLHVKFNKITYGGVTLIKEGYLKKNPNKIVYIGRLEKNTGLEKFLRWLDKRPNYTVSFCGEGVMRNQCKIRGRVYGNTNPNNFLKESWYCVPAGYLAALEGLINKCELKIFWSDNVKKRYWLKSPFIEKNARAWALKQTWVKLANEYLDLYNSVK